MTSNYSAAFFQVRGLRWPWQDPLKPIDSARAERALEKGKNILVQQSPEQQMAPLRSIEDLAELNYLEGGSVAPEKPALAAALRELEKRGWTFLPDDGGDPLGTFAVYNLLTEQNSEQKEALASPPFSKAETTVKPGRLERMADYYCDPQPDTWRRMEEEQNYQFFNRAGTPKLAFEAESSPTSHHIGRDGEAWLALNLATEDRLANMSRLLRLGLDTPSAREKSLLWEKLTQARTGQRDDLVYELLEGLSPPSKEEMLEEVLRGKLAGPGLRRAAKWSEKLGGLVALVDHFCGGEPLAKILPKVVGESYQRQDAALQLLRSDKFKHPVNGLLEKVELTPFERVVAEAALRDEPAGSGVAVCRALREHGRAPAAKRVGSRLLHSARWSAEKLSPKEKGPSFWRNPSEFLRDRLEDACELGKGLVAGFTPNSIPMAVAGLELDFPESSARLYESVLSVSPDDTPSTMGRSFEPMLAGVADSSTKDAYKIGRSLCQVMKAKGSMSCTAALAAEGLKHYTSGVHLYRAAFASAGAGVDRFGSVGFDAVEKISDSGGSRRAADAAIVGRAFLEEICRRGSAPLPRLALKANLENDNVRAILYMAALGAGTEVRKPEEMAEFALLLIDSMAEMGSQEEIFNAVFPIYEDLRRPDDTLAPARDAETVKAQLELLRLRHQFVEPKEESNGIEFEEDYIILDGIELAIGSH